MRWKEKEMTKPNMGKIKTITEFLWIPLKIKKETRWLETTTYRTQYVGDDSLGDEIWTPFEWYEHL